MEGGLGRAGGCGAFPFLPASASASAAAVMVVVVSAAAVAGMGRGSEISMVLSDGDVAMGARISACIIRARGKNEKDIHFNLFV